jgi:hypothetical protein
VAKLDTQGTPDGVHAFIIDLPAETKSVTPEVVLLKPVEAEFMAKVPEGRR